MNHLFNQPQVQPPSIQEQPQHFLTHATDTICIDKVQGLIIELISLNTNMNGFKFLVIRISTTRVGLCVVTYSGRKENITSVHFYQTVLLEFYAISTLEPQRQTDDFKKSGRIQNVTPAIRN